MNIIHWTVLILNFINDFQIEKMAENNSVVQSVKSYKFGKNSFWLNILHNKEWNRYLLYIKRKFTYIKKG